MPHDQSTVKPCAKLERLPPGNSFAWSLTFSRKKPPEFRALIDDLKSAVESWDRRYLPETYVWQIADGYVDALKVVMGRYGVELTVVGDVPSPGREQALHGFGPEVTTGDATEEPTEPLPYIFAFSRNLR